TPSSAGTWSSARSASTAGGGNGRDGGRTHSRGAEKVPRANRPAEKGRRTWPSPSARCRAPTPASAAPPGGPSAPSWSRSPSAAAPPGCPTGSSPPTAAVCSRCRTDPPPETLPRDDLAVAALPERSGRAATARSTRGRDGRQAEHPADRPLGEFDVVRCLPGEAADQPFEGADVGEGGLAGRRPGRECAARPAGGDPLGGLGDQPLHDPADRPAHRVVLPGELGVQGPHHPGHVAAA